MTFVGDRWTGAFAGEQTRGFIARAVGLARGARGARGSVFKVRQPTPRHG